MDLITFCCELKQRIPGCFSVTVYDLKLNEISTSDESIPHDNSLYLKEEKMFDNISKFGRGDHFASTIVLEDKTIMTLSCGKFKIVLYMKPNTNIGLVYSLLPSIETTFSSIEI